MVTKSKKPEVKVKAARVPISQLVVLSAYEKTFSSGKRGFFGQVQDVATGKKYQVIGAVELAPKAA
jgi:hypothetical protein